jgi:V/A-type H+-transporting ATPase subunit B
MRSGAGPGRTREDHLELAAQLLAALARARQVRELAEIVSASALNATDQLYLQLVDDFERHVVDQHPGERRTLDDTHDRCWDVANVLPRRELTMLSSRLVDAHRGPGA